MNDPRRKHRGDWAKAIAATPPVILATVAQGLTVGARLGFEEEVLRGVWLPGLVALAMVLVVLLWVAWAAPTDTDKE